MTPAVAVVVEDVGGVGVLEGVGGLGGLGVLGGLGEEPHWQNAGGQKGGALLQLEVHHPSVA